MTAILSYILAHKLGAAWLAAVMIERLPPPDANSSKLYAYIYGVIQFIAANTRRLQDAVSGPKAP